MTAHGKSLNPNEVTRIGDLGPKLFKIGGAVGLVGLLGAIAWGAAMGDDFRRFFHGYLVALCFFLGIAVGGLFLVLLHHLTRSKWSVVVRRIAEVLTMTFPLLGVLMLGIAVPLLAGYTGLYEWADPEVAHHDHLVHGKTGWLNPTFFAIRLVVYAVAWSLMGLYFYKKSVAQDAGGKDELSESMRIASAPAMLGFAIVTAFASFDLLMSLEPRWFSTIFPVYFFAGSVVSIFAVLALVSMFLQKRGILTKAISVEHYHDVGKLLFAFVFFWGYIAFSQFMLIWYANLPEETFWYAYRMDAPWTIPSVLLIFGHFVIPFVALMSRHTKRNPRGLAGFAIWMLLMHWFDLFWLVMPEYDFDTVSLHPVDLLLTVGVGGLFVAVAARVASKADLIPVNDPKLGASLAFENI